ncbi:hypothetical protein IE81DRAFT_324733 [Ceraceosorus guamensis]|uniref:Uncharacterized protein n=1 Tax=Ceraceosorus guamensis TaxID=1522189 RepID=A0A316VY68_9BASI|nr:hypothetical protein IE81DRAFT_324733 [Ceraceosorus guamensis]PWN41241.1 hypothetical protein IE81DRAFT_324733 [Ceraceosorus guamensis]
MASIPTGALRQFPSSSSSPSGSKDTVAAGTVQETVDAAATSPSTPSANQTGTSCGILHHTRTSPVSVQVNSALSQSPTESVAKGKGKGKGRRLSFGNSSRKHTPNHTHDGWEGMDRDLAPRLRLDGVEGGGQAWSIARGESDIADIIPHHYQALDLDLGASNAVEPNAAANSRSYDQALAHRSSPPCAARSLYAPPGESPLRRRRYSNTRRMVDMDDRAVEQAYELSNTATQTSRQRQASNSSAYPPSFAESQFATIIRRQRKRRIFSPTFERLESGDAVVGEEEVAQGEACAVQRKGRRLSGGRSRRRGHSAANRSAAAHFDGKEKHHHRRHSNGTYPVEQCADPGACDSFHVDDALDSGSSDWEFAGWGSMSMLVFNQTELDSAKHKVLRRPVAMLGQWRAFALAGNAVTGSAFYSLPAVLAVSGALSPIGMALAALLLWPFRPILVELASALGGSDAGNFTYLTNSTSGATLFPLLAAAFNLLDALATGAVSAATAASYISAETASTTTTTTHVDMKLISVLLILATSIICLMGIKDSSKVALGMISLHLVTMLILIIAGLISWIRMGNVQLRSNWVDFFHGDAVSTVSRRTLTRRSSGSEKSAVRIVFDATCLAFVGLTGVETTPAYVASVKRGSFEKALRNLHISILTEPMLALLIVAVMPLSSSIGTPNILASLAQNSTGAWLRYLVLTDACIVLSGGIITGVVALCGTVEALVSSKVLPGFLSWTLPRTATMANAVLLFAALTMCMCATARFDLTVLSGVFSMVFLCVLTCFPISLLCILHSRRTLPRERKASMLVIVTSLCIGLVAIAGNAALAPVTLAQMVAYTAVILFVLLALHYRIALVKMFLWTIAQEWTLWNRSSRIRKNAKSKDGLNRSSAWRKSIMEWIRKNRSDVVVYFTKTDEISTLVRVLSYIHEHEPACSRVILVHCFDRVLHIPSELEANSQLVDESFPTITVDLIFVQAEFTPIVVQALSDRLGMPTSRMFISCPSGSGIIQQADCSSNVSPSSTPSTSAANLSSHFELPEFGGLRIITSH